MISRIVPFALEVPLDSDRPAVGPISSAAILALAPGYSPIFEQRSIPYVNLSGTEDPSRHNLSWATITQSSVPLPGNALGQSFWLDEPLDKGELLGKALSLIPPLLQAERGRFGAGHRYGCCLPLERLLQRFLFTRGASSPLNLTQVEWPFLSNLVHINQSNEGVGHLIPQSDVQLNLCESPNLELAKQIATLQRRTQKHPLDPSVFDTGLVVFPKSAEGLNEHLRQGGRILTAHVGGELAGYCVYDPRATTVQLGDRILEKQANLIMIMNAPELRGRGLHDMLMYAMCLDLGLRSEAQGVVGWVCLSNLPSFIAHIGKHPWESLNYGKAIDLPRDLASKVPGLDPEVASHAIFVAMRMDLGIEGRQSAFSRYGYRQALELAYGSLDIDGVDPVLLMATRWAQRNLRKQYLQTLPTRTTGAEVAELNYLAFQEQAGLRALALHSGSERLLRLLQQGSVSALRIAMQSRI